MARYVVQYYNPRDLDSRIAIVRASSISDATDKFMAKHPRANVIYCDLASYTND